VHSTALDTAAIILDVVAFGALGTRYAVKRQWWSTSGMAVLAGALALEIVVTASYSRAPKWWYAVVIAGVIAATILGLCQPGAGYTRDKPGPRKSRATCGPGPGVPRLPRSRLSGSRSPGPGST
jgi:hypothetical protein